MWKIGWPIDTVSQDRQRKPQMRATYGKADLIMDLQADKKVPLSLQWTDEVGNPTGTPAGATATYSVDDTNVINLTDNGDGTAVAAATGTLGTATVHVDVVDGDVTLAGDLQLVVVAGMAERVEVVAGDPEEVTPDA